MKRSNRVLVGAAVAVVVLALAGVIAARLLGTNTASVAFAGAPAPRFEQVQLKSISYDLSGFDRIQASGAWGLSLHAGPTYSVSVEVPEGVANRIDVHRSGKTLVFSLRAGTTTSRERLVAHVTMPELGAVVLSGANRLSFSGFSGNRLRLECSGAATVSGDSGAYEQLEIDASGASTVLLRDLRARNADVRLSGAGEVQLLMQGGSLSGRASGAARVTYWGTTSQEAIETSGIARVIHR